MKMFGILVPYVSDCLQDAADLFNQTKNKNVFGIILWYSEEISHKCTVTVCIRAPMTSIRGHFPFTYMESQEAGSDIREFVT